jgi:hypothetical protein
MRLLYVKKLYLWPRFHQAVIEDLQAHQPEVIELHQPMTPLMSSIQECIVEIMRACLQELKSSNQVANTHTHTHTRTLSLSLAYTDQTCDRYQCNLDQMDISSLEEEGGFFRDFEHVIRTQLDACWHTVGAKSKQLLSDLRNLRRLLLLLVKYDCVTYNRYLENLRIAEFNHRSVWLFLDAGNRLFRLAKRRVFCKVTPATASELLDSQNSCSSSSSNVSSISILDSPPASPNRNGKQNNNNDSQEGGSNAHTATAAIIHNDDDDDDDSNNNSNNDDGDDDDAEQQAKRRKVNQEQQARVVATSTSSTISEVTTLALPKDNSTVGRKRKHASDTRQHDAHQDELDQLSSDDDTQPHDSDKIQQELDELDSQTRSDSSLLCTPNAQVRSITKSPTRSCATTNEAAPVMSTTTSNTPPGAPKSEEFDLVLEENPKWGLLLEVLDEIQRENVPSGPTGEPGRILIAVSDERSCRQVQEFLSLGGRAMLYKLWVQYNAHKPPTTAIRRESDACMTPNAPYGGFQSTRGGRGGRGASCNRGKSSSSSKSYHARQKARAQNRFMSTATTAREQIRQSTAGATVSTPSPSPSPSSSSVMQTSDAQVALELVTTDVGPYFDQYFGLLLPPTIVVHPIGSHVLDEMHPKFVIVFDPDIRFIRQIEV